MRRRNPREGVPPIVQSPRQRATEPRDKRIPGVVCEDKDFRRGLCVVTMVRMRKLDSRTCWEHLAPQLINHPDCPEWLRSLANNTVSARFVTGNTPPFSGEHEVSLRVASVDEHTIKDREEDIEVAERSVGPFVDDSAEPYRRDTEFLRGLVGNRLAQLRVRRYALPSGLRYETGHVLWFSPDDFQLIRIASSIVVGRPIQT